MQHHTSLMHEVSKIIFPPLTTHLPSTGTAGTVLARSPISPCELKAGWENTRVFLTPQTKLIAAMADDWIVQQGTWAVGFGEVDMMGHRGGKKRKFVEGGFGMWRAASARGLPIIQMSLSKATASCQQRYADGTVEGFVKHSSFLLKGTCRFSREPKLFSSISDSLRLAEPSRVSQRLTVESKTLGVRNSLAKCSCSTNGALA